MFSDPLSTDACTVTIDWGDGTESTPDAISFTLNAGQTSFTSPTHQYTASGDYTIVTTVSNTQGSVTSTTEVTAYALAEIGIGADIPVASENTQTAGEFTIGRMDGGDINQPLDVYLLLDAASTALLNTDFNISGATDMDTQIDGCEE